MKLSVSLPAEDVAFLDGYAKARAYSSRSAVVHRAIETLRGQELGDAYDEAWAEFSQSGEASVWETTVGDSI